MAAEQALSEAEAARAVAQENDGEARAAMSDAEGEVKALSAEVAGLERLLARDADGGSKLVDQVAVEAGFEAALGAALGEDLNVGEAEGAESSGWIGLDRSSWS